MTAEVAISELALAELPGEEHTPVVTTLFPELRPVYITGSRFLRTGMGTDFGGVPITVILERIGWTIEGTNRDGSIRSNPFMVKILREIWPVIRGTPGDTINVYAGYQSRSPEEAVIWQGPFPFVIGQSVSVQPLVEGVYLAARFVSIGQNPWSLLSLTADIDPTGEPYP